MAKFPRAGSVEPKEADPMMKRVDQNNGEIGSRKGGMPKHVKSDGMSLRHVGDGGKS
jgi:hypothetical protein